MLPIAGLAPHLALIGVSPERFARRHGLDVKVLKRWIRSGYAPAAAVRDICLALWCSRRLLVGRETPGVALERAELMDRYLPGGRRWVGNLGVGVPGREKTFWIPLGGLGYRCAGTILDLRGWTMVPAIDGCLYFLNLDNLDRVLLREEKFGYPNADWEIEPLVGYDGEFPVTREALEEWALGEVDFGFGDRVSFDDPCAGSDEECAGLACWERGLYCWDDMSAPRDAVASGAYARAALRTIESMGFASRSAYANDPFSSEILVFMTKGDRIRACVDSDLLVRMNRSIGDLLLGGATDVREGLSGDGSSKDGSSKDRVFRAPLPDGAILRARLSSVVMIRVRQSALNVLTSGDLP